MCSSKYVAAFTGKTPKEEFFADGPTDANEKAKNIAQAKTASGTPTQVIEVKLANQSAGSSPPYRF